jgi:hypothetical protein
VLQRSRIDTLVCQLEAAGMAQHVWMHAKRHLGGTCTICGVSGPKVACEAASSCPPVPLWAVHFGHPTTTTSLARLLCQLSPAAEMPPHEAMSEKCHKPTFHGAFLTTVCAVMTPARRARPWPLSGRACRSLR